MTRIYTRGGDAGETSVAGGARLPKHHARVDLYGEVDELASLLGAVRAFLRGDGAAAPAGLDAQLAALQGSLLELGGLLADPDRCERAAREATPPPGVPVAELEAWIDAWSAGLPPLRSFLLPGGTPAGALLHVARTVCRRLERRAVAAAERIAVPPGVLAWLNRLSDYLFTAARAANAAAGVAEQPWRPAGGTGASGAPDDSAPPGGDAPGPAAP